MPNKELAGAVAVVGVGHTRYGRLPDHDPYDLGIWALKEALADCGLQRSDIDGVILNRIPDYQRFCELAGLDPAYTTITPGHGRFSGICIQTAVALIAAGMAKTVALIYGNNGRSSGDQYGGDTDIYGSGGPGLWFPYGMTSPGAFHAMMMRRHMALHGTTQDQLGEIAMTFRRHAALNPNAVMRDPFSLEQYRASRYICEPLHLLDYCLINDGGVAMILTSAERARDAAKPPVYIRGFGQAAQFTGSTFPPEDFWCTPMRKVAADAYGMAGVRAHDMDALMIYDNFTPTVLFCLEGFGFCPVGEGGRFVENGRLALDGQFPTNTSGGHLSESYMQGWALNVEAVRQVRGEGGARQVSGAALVQYMTAAPVITSVIYGSERQ